MLVTDVMPSNAVEVIISTSNKSFILSVIPSLMACATAMVKQANNTMAPSMRLEDRYPDEAEKISRSMFCFCCFISHIVFSQLDQTYSP